jgi:hypothetical protein
MFKIDQVENLWDCEQCNQLIIDPVTIVCGYSVCNRKKIPYMQTFRFIKVTRYHEGTNEKYAYMVFFPHNHYQIVYLCFSVFQSTLNNCFFVLNL